MHAVTFVDDAGTYPSRRASLLQNGNTHQRGGSFSCPRIRQAGQKLEIKTEWWNRKRRWEH
jgi:hypothetical protein